MPIRTACPRCGTKMLAPERTAGHSLPCPSCDAWVPIPAEEAEPARPRRRDDEGASGFRCPHCGTRRQPHFARRVSTGGWILFAVLSLTCLGLLISWVGLLMTEEIAVCSDCGIPIGRHF